MMSAVTLIILLVFGFPLLQAALLGQRTEELFDLVLGNAGADVVDAHIRLYRDEIDINARARGEWTALALASSSGETETVATLLRFHADPNIPEGDGFTALLFGAHHGHHRIVDALLYHGANLMHKSTSGQTALSLASNDAVRGVLNQHLAHMKTFPAGGEFLEHARLGNVVQARDLLHRRGRFIVNGEVNERGWASLHFAASAGHSSMLTLLLSHGGDVNVAEQDGWNPLLFAINAKCADCVNQILDAGGEISTKDAFDHMVQVADTHGEIITMLAGAALQQHLEKRPLTGGLVDGGMAIAGFIAAGANPNIANSHGVTSLMLLAQAGELERVGAIIVGGADVNWQEMDGWTALMFAVHGNSYDVVRLLVENEETDLDAVNRHSDSALDLARKLERESIVRLLVQAGAGAGAGAELGDEEEDATAELGDGRRMAPNTKENNNIFRFFGF